ncbi:uncharacterized protein involved in response to NO [Natronospira proteinivora]|uniref:Uncharacterized protein involved in response to NO n=1 Tax=Natronospira proteinivora TaxID=1807133 RepID=A0ABT1GA95_9GAMM|nr:NnrS family protein [Natronospira proteinivora]MCP1727178.1 uncharacterized protein involved in response to NO [Natronospira proteinivora]
MLMSLLSSLTVVKVFTARAGKPFMHSVLRQPYRLFFLGAAAYAVIHMLLWLAHLQGLWTIPAPISFAWHGYELLFGFAAAVICGFILTASENWTGYRSVNAPGLLFLFLAWLLARLAALLGLSPLLVLIGDGLVLGGLTLALARVLWLSGNRRNLRFLPITGGLALAAILVQLSFIEVIPHWQDWLLRAAVDLVLILMVIMGGRVIPFFTQRKLPNLDVMDPDWLGFYATAFVVISVVLTWLVPGGVAAMFSWFAGCFLMARLFYWSPWGTRRHPMLWILHLGYFWLGLALFLRGGSLAWDWMAFSDTVHAITVGGMGCLTLGMMARVTQGHGGHEIRAPLWLVPAFALIALAAIPRLLAAWPAIMPPQWGYSLSAIAWILAFLIFTLGFAPKLLQHRRD